MKIAHLICICLLACLSLSSLAFCAEGKWQGLDETVVGKIAEEHGRKPMEPMINTGEGDMQLFVFMIAGVLGGFAAGYYWRVLLDGKIHKKDIDCHDV